MGRGVARTGLGVLGRGVGAGVGAIGDRVGAYVGPGIGANDGDCERVGGTDAVSAKLPSEPPSTPLARSATRKE